MPLRGRPGRRGPLMAGATHDDLAELEARIVKRMDDQLETIKTLLEPLTASNRSSEACIKLGFETVQKALTPTTLGMLIVLVALVIGGAPVSLAVVQTYLPHPPAGNVQINSNNAPATDGETPTP